MSEQRTTLENEFAISGMRFTPEAVSLSGAIFGTLETHSLALEVFGHSQAGRSEKRQANQDYFYLPVQQPESISSGSFLFAVADGVGGADHGERASEMSVKEILRHYYAFSRHGVNHQAAFTQAAQQAHHIVKREGERRGHTMATTLVSVIVPVAVTGENPLSLDFACAGDSRAYIFRAAAGRLEPATKDSLWYEDEQRRGGEAAKQADALVKANPRLLQSPRTIGGIGTDLQVDFFNNITAQTGDIVLLCSDGVYKPLGDVQGIEPILAENRADLNAAATLMLNAVRRQGGFDDATLVLIRVVKAGVAPAVVPPPPVPVSATPEKTPEPAVSAAPAAPPAPVEVAPAAPAAARTAAAPAPAAAKTGGLNPALLAGGALLLVLLLALLVWGLGGDDAPPAADVATAEPSPVAALADAPTPAPVEAAPTDTPLPPSPTPEPPAPQEPAEPIEPVEPVEPTAPIEPTPAPANTDTPTPEPPTATPSPEPPTATPSPEPLPTEPPAEEPPAEAAPAEPPAEDTAAEAADAAPPATESLPTAADCQPGSCKYAAPPALGKPAPGAVYDSDAPFEFGWGYQSVGLDEFYDIRIYDSPDATAPVRALAVRDRNFIQLPLSLACQDYYWSIRIGSAGAITPDPAIPGLFTVNPADYTGARSPESARWPFSWRVNCPGGEGQ